MKKLLFLLLITVASYSQTLQNPTFGTVKLKQNVTDNSATKVNVQAVDGSVNTIAKSDLVNVENYASAVNLPSPGVAGKIYITNDNNKIYRWNGTFYQELAPADLSSKVDKVIGKSLILDTEITRLAGVNNYTHPASHPPSIITQDASNRFVTDAEKVAWNAKQNNLGFTPENVANKSGTLTASSTLYPNNNAVIAALAPKIGSTVDNDIYVNSHRLGRGSGNVLDNTVFGLLALDQNISGSANSIFGAEAGYNLTGAGNSLFGKYAGYNTQGSNFLTAVGFRALNSLVSNNTVGIGADAGRITSMGNSLTSAQNSIFIGYNSSPLENVETNQIVIAYDGKGLGSNTTVIGNSLTQFGRWWGNLLINKSTNNGKPLQVAGSADVGDLTITTTPTTAIGTPPLLAHNATTGAVQSVPYSNFATTASPAFTGTPTAPTASIGTNTTQVATTAFVLANSGTSTSGSYTPTLSGANNLSSITLKSASYIKVGDIVSVSVAINATTSSANASTSITLTLPINKTTTTVVENGTCSVGGSNNFPIAMGYVIINQTTATLQTATTNQSGTDSRFRATFQYNVSQ